MSIIELAPDETILRIAHKHYYSFIGDSFSIIVLAVLPLVFAFICYFFIPTEVLDHIFTGNASVGVAYLTVSGLLFAWLYGWWRWTDHFLNVVVITNKRIFEIHQHGFFSREVKSFGLDRIQDITTKQDGVLATMLGFGSMHVETAGEDENLDMNIIPNPGELKQFINELQDYQKRAHV